MRNISNRDPSQISWKLGPLQTELEDHVVNSCQELKLKITRFLQAYSEASGANEHEQLVSNAQPMISFSSTLALSHQLLRQHYLKTDVKGRRLTAT
jgi:hypothetical protein